MQFCLHLLFIPSIQRKFALTKVLNKQSKCLPGVTNLIFGFLFGNIANWQTSSWQEGEIYYVLGE